MDYYAPIQRGLSNISGLLERGAERRSRHGLEMAQLGLMGRRAGMEQERLGMEQERLGMERGEHALRSQALGMDVKEKARLLTQQEEERQRLNMPSNLNDANKLSEFVGVAPFNQGNEFWVSYFADVIPKNKHRHDDSTNPEKITGFDVPKGEVSKVVNRVLARVAETDPVNLIGIRDGYRDLQQYLIDELGATPEGSNKQSAQLRLAMSEDKKLSAQIDAFSESPAAGLASIMILRGSKAVKDPGYRKIGQAYLDAVIEKTKGKPGRLYPTQEGGYQPPETAIGLTPAATELQFSPKQLADAPFELQNDLFEITHTENKNKETVPIVPSEADIQALRMKANRYGYDIAPTGRMLKVKEKRKWARDIETGTPEYMVVPLTTLNVPKLQGQYKDIEVTGGPPEPTPEEALEELRRRGISF